MQIDVQQVDDDTCVLAPCGRLNMVAAPRLRALVVQTVDEGRSLIVVDLTRTEFMDSSGLGALIAGLKVARQAGGDLRIAGLTEQVHMVLELTNLDQVLRPYRTVEEALDAA